MNHLSVLSRLTLLSALLAIPSISLGQASSTPAGISQESWSAIKAVHEADLHQVKRTESGHQAHNPGQDWSTEFDGEGFVVQPGGFDWTWGLQLMSFGFEGEVVAVEREAKASAEGNRMTYDWTSNVQEWYINDRRGLEHGYTVQSQPAKGSRDGAPLTFTLNVRGNLSAQVQADGQGVWFLDAKGVAAVTYSGLHVHDALGIDQPARIESSGESIRFVVDDSNAQYPLTIDPTAQQAYLKASNTDAGDKFGWAIAASGDLVVIGAPEEDSLATGVDGNQSDNSGIDCGAAYIFRRVGNSWVQEAYLKASNTDDYDEFGYSVGISGNRVVIGASGEASGSLGVNGNQSDNGRWASGAAYVFVESNGVWSQEAYLKASNTAFLDVFGFSVAISGDLIVVGARNEGSASTGVNGNQADNSAARAGAAYVFRLTTGSWAQEAYLKASNTDAEDRFGGAIAVSDGLVVVGSAYEDSASTGINGIQSDNSASNSGAVYVYRSVAGVWSQEAYIKASNAELEDWFGYSVAAADGQIITSAVFEDSNATGAGGNQADNSILQSGAAYIFAENAGTWIQTAYLKASNPDMTDNFGRTVGISGSRAVVGSHVESSSAPGINPGGFDNNTGQSGSAYLFEQAGGVWNINTQITASNPGAYDRFGTTAAISGDLLVIGAPGEASSSTGIGGDQSDDSASSAGAAYVFNLDAPVATFCEPTAANSVGLHGQISMTGSLLVGDNAFSLHVDGLPQNQTGYFVNSQSMGYLHVVAGSQGSLCVGLGNSPLGRHNRSHEIRNTGAAGAFGLTLDLTDIPTASGARAVIAGETWNFQAWYRDMNPNQTSNFSNGLAVQFE